MLDTESHHSWHHPTVEYIVVENILETIQTDPRAERVILEAVAAVEHAAEAEAEIGARGRKQRTVTQTVLDEG